MPYPPPVLRYVGYWEERYAGDHDYPDPRQLVQKAWIGSEEMRLLIAYLERGVIYAAFRGFSWCRFNCGIENRQMGSCDLTDGKWIWPQGLAHYIEAHDVILPGAFLKEAIENNGYVDREKAQAYEFNEQYLRNQLERIRKAGCASKERPVGPRPKKRAVVSRQFWIRWAKKKIVQRSIRDGRYGEAPLPGSG